MKDLTDSQVTSPLFLAISSPMNPAIVRYIHHPCISWVFLFIPFPLIDNPSKWGIRIESALAVKRVKVGLSEQIRNQMNVSTLQQTKGEFNGNIWLGFERLTCVPIQTKMVKESMLSKEEKQWLKVGTLHFHPNVASFIHSFAFSLGT